MASSQQEFSFGVPFSTTNALQTFMTTRGQDATRLRVTTSPHFASTRSEPVSTAPQTPTPSPPDPPTQSLLPLPTPDLHPSTSPRSFFVSPELLQRRNLARQIEHLYPAAELIERGPLSTSPSSHSVTDSSLQAEADLLLSPGTGLLCTNLQMIKQRSLPGQVYSSPIQTRILSVYERYERLTILVSEGRLSGGGGGGQASSGTTNTPLDQRDCLALATLQGFAARLLDGDVQVIYVPGGEMELARWVVDLMIRAPGPTIKLPHEETQTLTEEMIKWEIFLRRAGLNPYAAQAILLDIYGTCSSARLLPSHLSSRMTPQQPSMTKEDQRTVSPLATFLKMTHAQRIERFGALLGGTRLLTRFAREEIQSGLRGRVMV